METIYYDTVKSFAKDLEKMIKEKVEIIESKKQIKLHEEIISYEERNIGLRSFSIPYFVENETIIEYNGKDEELKEKVNNMC